MNVQINQLVKSLLKKNSIEDCSVQELEQFADRHPYFGAAQLLLTKKYKEENSDRFDEQLQKTFLFFNNPLWVQHLLNDTGQAEIITENRPVEESPTSQADPDTITTPLPVNGETVNGPGITPEQEGLSFKPADSSLSEPVNFPTDLPEPAQQTGESPLIAEQPEVVYDVEPASEEIKKPKEELLFEPFHTVDYFASQGIKMKEDAAATDRFSKQLRSFTDWLKTMKRLPVAEIALNSSPAADQNVEQLAEHSLEEKEVNTEAMAAVWEKQGNTGKAIHVYQKLSLLDPSKSAYFAAKIEELKKKN